MKYRLVLPFLGAAVLAFTASNADAFIMRWDPGAQITGVSLTDLLSPGTGVFASSQSCTTPGFGANFKGLTSCFAFANLTTDTSNPNGMSIDSFSFSFKASQTGSFTCTFDAVSSSDTTLDQSNCPITMTNGKTATVRLFGGDALAYNGDLDLGFDFTVSGGYGTPNPVPEPAELGMFGIGLLLIGAGYGWDKRRRERNSDKSTR